MGGMVVAQHTINNDFDQPLHTRLGVCERVREREIEQEPPWRDFVYILINFGVWQSKRKNNITYKGLALAGRTVRFDWCDRSFYITKGTKLHPNDNIDRCTYRWALFLRKKGLIPTDSVSENNSRHWLLKANTAATGDGVRKTPPVQAAIAFRNIPPPARRRHSGNHLEVPECASCTGFLFLELLAVRFLRPASL